MEKFNYKKYKLGDLIEKLFDREKHLLFSERLSLEYHFMDWVEKITEYDIKICASSIIGWLETQKEKFINKEN